MIPDKNANPTTMGIFHFIQYANPALNTIVRNTSNTAISNIRNPWAPLPGTPNAFLYLHKPSMIGWISGDSGRIYIGLLKNAICGEKKTIQKRHKYTTINTLLFIKIWLVYYLGSYGRTN
jgi:hypothetical protein